MFESKVRSLPFGAPLWKGIGLGWKAQWLNPIIEGTNLATGNESENGKKLSKLQIYSN
jgi:hypothetical protein